MDYSHFPIPKVKSRPKPEVKKDGRLVLSPYRWAKQKLEMWNAAVIANSGSVICHLCKSPIRSFGDFEPDHIITKGHGGGKRDDRRGNLAPSHAWCNRERGSKPSVENGKVEHEPS